MIGRFNYDADGTRDCEVAVKKKQMKIGKLMLILKFNVIMDESNLIAHLKLELAR